MIFSNLNTLSRVTCLTMKMFFNVTR